LRMASARLQGAESTHAEGLTFVSGLTPAEHCPSYRRPPAGSFAVAFQSRRPAGRNHSRASARI